MKTLICFCILLLSAAQAVAGSINVPGESAHVAGGIVVAGGITAIADKYWPEHRAWIGFGVSTACGILGEAIDQVSTGEKLSSSLQDVAFQTIGAAIGAAITDRYILSPVIKEDHPGSTYVGFALQHIF